MLKQDDLDDWSTSVVGDMEHSHFTFQMSEYVSIKILWKNRLQMFRVKKNFDPGDPEVERNLLRPLNNIFRTHFKMSDLPFKGPICLEDFQIFVIKDNSRSGANIVSPSNRLVKQESLSSGDEEEKQIREASRALIYKDIDANPEIDDLERWGIDDSEGSLNDSDGYSARPQIPRELMLTPTKDLGEVWNQVESRLKIPREHFSLVSDSHYLEQSGQWRNALEKVEIRFRGRGAGFGKKAKVTGLHPTDTIYCAHEEQDIDLEFEGGACARDLESALYEDFEDFKICRHINGEKRIILPEEFIQAGIVYVHQAKDFGEDLHRVTIRGVIDSVYGDGLPQEISLGAKTLSEIRDYIETLSSWSVRNIWNGLFPLEDEDAWLGGAIVDVEYDQEPNTMGIRLGSKMETFIDTLIRPLDELFEWIRQCYGLKTGQELVLLKEQDWKPIDAYTKLANECFVLKEVHDGTLKTHYQFPGAILEETYFVDATTTIQIKKKFSGKWEWNVDPGLHSRLDAWLQEVKESYRIGFQKVYERWLQIRKNMLRHKPCRKGTIEILFYEPCGSHWRIAKLKCTEPYRPEVLFEEIKSWLQDDVCDTTGW
jgi:hypothetical protein